MNYEILTVGLKWLPNYLCWVIVEATKFDEFQKPISWAIRKSSLCLSKKTKEWEYEPMPSSRDDEYYEEFRFSSLEEAITFWETFN